MNKLQPNEKENRDCLVEQLKPELKRILSGKIRIDKEVPVPYKHIYLPNKGMSVLEVWCFKQDICLFEELFSENIEYKEAKVVGVNGKKLIDVTLEKDSAQRSHPVGLPFVIVETKMAKSINTHELLAYSQKVQMIKTIFPYVEYALVFFGRPPARAFRHGVSFDSIVSIDDLSKESVKKVAQGIRFGYRKAKKRIQELQKTEDQKKKRLQTNRSRNKKTK